MLGLLGAKAIDPTARSTCESLTGTKVAPPSAERQIPPLEAPTRISCGSPGETAIALMRPLLSPKFAKRGAYDRVGMGPIGVHVWARTDSIPKNLPRVAGGGRLAQASRRASTGMEANG